jgi:Zn-dependent metalloprotease
MILFKGVFMKVRRNKAIMLMAIGITAILLPILMAQTKVDNAHKSDKQKASTTEKEEIVSTRVNENRGLVDKYGIPTELSGNLSAGLTASDPVEKAFQFFDLHKTQFHIEDARKEFKLRSSTKGPISDDYHVKLDQIVNGVKVRSGMYALHFQSDGSLYLVDGQIDPEAKKVDTNPAISEEMAKQIAISENNSDTLAKDYTKSNGLLIINTKNGYHLIWDIECGLMIYRIDAQTGTIIESGSSAIH